MKSESPFQKMTFSAFLFLLKLSVSHNDHEMLSFIRNTLFTESLQIGFITKSSVVSCHPLPSSQTGLALNSTCWCLAGHAFSLMAQEQPSQSVKEAGHLCLEFHGLKEEVKVSATVAKSSLPGRCLQSISSSFQSKEQGPSMHFWSLWVSRSPLPSSELQAPLCAVFRRAFLASCNLLC